ncbi:MAG: glutathione S-transferase N-terminal domain-containing protein [Pseudomonadota bacterium]
MSFVGYSLFWIMSLASSIFRLGAGGARLTDQAPAQKLILYEFEGCPFCRIAREAISESGIPVVVRPCPKGGERFRPSVSDLGGKAQFPFLIDPNTDRSFYESAYIASYVARTYGVGRPLVHLLGPIGLALSQFATLARVAAGTLVWRSKQNDKPLEFYGAERHPTARLVKERLCAMELEYVWNPYTDGSVKLVDPNTGASVTGGLPIRLYLADTYRL